MWFARYRIVAVMVIAGVVAKGDREREREQEETARRFFDELIRAHAASTNCARRRS